MCHFITLVLPPDANRSALESVFARPLETIENERLSAQLEPGEIQVCATASRCDCGTMIGSAKRDPRDGLESHERQIAKLRKKGWGEAKIERWRDSKRNAVAKRERAADARADRSGPEGEDWIRTLRRAVRSGAARYVGLLLHWYSGALTNAPITVAGRETISLRTVVPEDLARFEEDVLYVFSP